MVDSKCRGTTLLPDWYTINLPFLFKYIVWNALKNAVKYAHGDRRGPDRMVVGSITTYAISAYTTNTMSLNPARARCTRYNIVTWSRSWFSPGTPIYSYNKTDRHDIAEILLKVALNTIAICAHVLLFFWEEGSKSWCVLRLEPTNLLQVHAMIVQDEE